MKLTVGVLVLVLLAGAASALVGSQVVEPFYRVACVFYQAMINVAGAIAGLMMLYAGVKWVMSQEEPAKRQHAKDIMKFVIIGLIAVGLVKAFLDLLFGTWFC